MRWITVAAVFSLLCLAGCGECEPVTGTVEEPGQVHIGSHIWDFPVTLENGKKSTLSRIRLGVTIVGFTAPSADGCLTPHPILRDLSNDLRFVDLPVLVLQIGLPCPAPTSGPASRPAEPCCRQAKSSDRYLMLLHDPDRVAFDAFFEPQPGQLFLLDWNDQIIWIATLDKPGYLPQRAEQLARNYYDTYRVRGLGR